MRIAQSRSTKQLERFLAALGSARREQETFLRERLLENAATAFGHEHAFDRISGIDDFQAAVPIRNYDAIAPWIERAFSGERNVLTRDDPTAFLRTSGTTGSSKKIPHTRAQGHYETYAQWIAWGAVLRAYPELVARDDTTINLAVDPVSDPTPVPYLPSTQMSFAKGRDPMDGFPGYNAPWSRPPNQLEHPVERLYYRLRLALEHDLLAIMSINPSSLVALMQIFEQRRLELIEDVCCGTLLGRPFGVPNPERAKEIERAYRPRELWPHLKLLRCWTSASAARYIPELRALYGDVDIWPYPTIASEGAVAAPLDSADRRPVLLVTTGFFEFIPSGEAIRPDSPTRLFDELDEGREYTLIQTRANGLYRYDLGDVYRVIGFVGPVPCLEFIGRNGGFSSFTGEKLTEWQVVATAEAALRGCSLEARSYVWFPKWGTPPSYVLFVEPTAPWAPIEVTRLSEALETQLAKHNDEYLGKRRSGRLGPISIELASPGTFARYWRAQIDRGVAPSQVKIAPLQKDEDLLRTFSAHSLQDQLNGLGNRT